MVDSDGFRPNVGIIVANDDGRVLWARRAGEDAWQFPQGGVEANETPLEALYRELREEVGLGPADVAVLGATRRWLRYRLPRRMIRRRGSRCIGQKQIWFLLRLLADEQRVRVDRVARPEFDRWRWVDYWYPVEEVIFFKRQVYRQALQELSGYLQADDWAGTGTEGGPAAVIPPAARRRLR
ncbi:RNA pyrophosphohydrolase [Halorhodospira halophila]|uniref:RNA pyrophosphohydrolase n=2 Tax=Pseudomonadota TaxID=1224 RepID=RPPH_HALHL|nr:RNA pyrophosphohydrolase [Halorhodospira halophila]A1WVE9.1 RecName: Full=RNA pyrophosphohydrolase; AltName: Full=(Di)nucleoside polyphosphate hydrolase [Halorhodospira halophila SL1]ABM61661.1 NUDIX hydrolase [Halorhodospira halophila SL1]MBK1729006.1 RNA pyrophosphohydrolase [Halorhodospira halophila]